MVYPTFNDMVTRADGHRAITVNLHDPQEGVMFVGRENAEMEEELVDILEDIITEVIRMMELTGDDMLGLTIEARNSAGEPVSIGIRPIPWTDFDAFLVMDQIEQALVSDISLSLDEAELKFVRIRSVQPVFGGNYTRNKYGGVYELFTKHKKSIVLIHPDADEYDGECLFQFFVIGLAYLVHHGKPFNRHALPAGLLEQNTYKKFISSGSKYTLRHDACNVLRQTLGECSTDIAYLERFQELFHVKCVLYHFTPRLGVSYPLQFSQENECSVLSGLMENRLWTESMVLGHIDFVPSVHALGDTKRKISVCVQCFEVYYQSSTCKDTAHKDPYALCRNCHTCQCVCSTCFSQTCGYISKVPSSRHNSQCQVCKSNYYSDECERLHAVICKPIQMKRKCMKCNRAEHGGLKCDQSACLMCGAKVKFSMKDDHHCFIQRQKLKKESTQYWVYDFECCLDENQNHIPYLCTAWPLYSIEEGNWCSKYTTTLMTGYVNQPMFVFWGLEGVNMFFQFLCEPALQGTTFFAHNSGRYDSVIVEREMMHQHQMVAQKIQRGTRIMNLYYTELDVTFKDSLCFIPSALRDMPNNFGVEELRKGFFPHKLMTVEYMKQSSLSNFKVMKPSQDFFPGDFRVGKAGREEKKELDIFLKGFYEGDNVWDLKKDAIEYCISDTFLLGQVLRIFRESTMEITYNIPRPTDIEKLSFDPFRYITLPSAVMAFYMSQLLPLNRISVIDRSNCLVRQQFRYWFEWMKQKHPSLCICTEGVQHARTVDSSHIFMFLSCYDNGCCKCTLSSARNIRNKLTFASCRLNMEEKMKDLYKKYPDAQVHTWWEHEFRDIQRTIAYKEWLADKKEILDDIIPIDPRDAYKGGVSELYKLHVKGQISMSDFVSQYPTALLGKSFSAVDGSPRVWKLPVGRPFIYLSYSVTKFLNEGRHKLGIIKCRVVPPRHLYVPFLGHKVPSMLVKNSYEVIYGLCKVCMETRQFTECRHEKNDRSFVGTWTTAELDYALTLGYEILSIVEVWEYEGADESLFRNFIIPFMKTKICCKKGGIVDSNTNEFTADGAQVKAYLEQMTGEAISVDDFKDAPALRTIAKLVMNAFYGKWGQRSEWPETKAFTESEEDMQCLAELLDNSDVELKTVELVAEAGQVLAVVEFQKLACTSKGNIKKNDHIAAYVTAYGRIMLNEVSQKLGRKMIYVDTDSLTHEYSEELPYATGFRVGDLELELPLATNWCGNGRKSYVYEKPSGEVICKQKGISLKASHAAEFTPDKMLSMITATKRKHDEYMSEYPDDIGMATKKFREDMNRPGIKVPQKMFKTKIDKWTGVKKSVEVQKETRFLIESMKRIPVGLLDRQNYGAVVSDVLDTVPFGYIRPDE